MLKLIESASICRWCLLHFGELDVEGPQFRRSLSGEIGAQQIPAFVTSAGAQA